MSDVAAPAPGGPMKLASKRLKAVGRVVGRTAANHSSTRLRQQEKRNQEGKVTLARIGRLKTRKRTFLDKPTVARQPPPKDKESIAAASPEDAFEVSAVPTQPELWGDLSALRSGTPAGSPDRLTSPELGVTNAERLQRMELATRNGDRIDVERCGATLSPLVAKKQPRDHYGRFPSQAAVLCRHGRESAAGAAGGNPRSRRAVGARGGRSLAARPRRGAGAGAKGPAAAQRPAL